jgi:hypothetical protein
MGSCTDGISLRTCADISTQYLRNSNVAKFGLARVDLLEQVDQTELRLGQLVAHIGCGAELDLGKRSFANSIN